MRQSFRSQEATSFDAVLITTKPWLTLETEARLGVISQQCRHFPGLTSIPADPRVLVRIVAASLTRMLRLSKGDNHARNAHIHLMQLLHVRKFGICCRKSPTRSAESTRNSALSAFLNAKVHVCKCAGDLLHMISPEDAQFASGSSGDSMRWSEHAACAVSGSFVLVFSKPRPYRGTYILRPGPAHQSQVSWAITSTDETHRSLQQPVRLSVVACRCPLGGAVWPKLTLPGPAQVLAVSPRFARRRVTPSERAPAIWRQMQLLIYRDGLRAGSRARIGSIRAISSRVQDDHMQMRTGRHLRAA